jgi:hypothetical protein
MDISSTLNFISQQGAEIAALKHEIASLKAVPTVSATDASRISSLETEITSLKATIAMKQTINDELSAQNDSQIVQINELKRMNEAIQAQLNATNAKDSEQTAQITTFQAQITKLTAQVVNALRPVEMASVVITPVAAPVAAVPTAPVATAPVMSTKLNRDSTMPRQITGSSILHRAYNGDAAAIRTIIRLFQATGVKDSGNFDINVEHGNKSYKLGWLTSLLRDYSVDAKGEAVHFFNKHTKSLTDEGRDGIRNILTNPDPEDVKTIKALCWIADKEFSAIGIRNFV